MSQESPEALHYLSIITEKAGGEFTVNLMKEFQQSSLKELLIEKGLITQEEIDARLTQHLKVFASMPINSKNID